MTVGTAINLRGMLTGGRPDPLPVCADADFNWGALKAARDRIAAQLIVSEKKLWLIASESGFHFAASLLACWRRGQVALISPGLQPAVLARLADLIDGAIGDPKLAAHLPVPIVDPTALEPTGETNDATAEPGPEDTALELFTSGSTGERKRVRKTFRQLESELEVLEQLWGRETEQTRRFATVSHFHIYGLLFKLLWPLCAGAPFPDQSHFFWEELLAAAGDKPVTVISSPAHLKHLVQVASGLKRDWSRDKLFSSGGPLPRSVAVAIEKACGHAPVEVFGSTETGGIAHRSQSVIGDIPWHPMPGIDFRLDADRLEIRSPFLERADVWTPTGDRARMNDHHRFTLLGRADRIVKLSEKRVSLTEMERVIDGLSWVEMSRVLVLPNDDDTRRERLAGVVAPSESGRQRLQHEGKQALVAELRDILAQHFEAVTLPRLWRFPDKMPTDAQGKLPLENLIALFADYTRPKKPILLNRELVENGERQYYQVPEDLIYLEGHFPNAPIVPGVCLLAWVFDAIAIFRGSTLAVKGMEVVKFHQVLQPGDRFYLEFSFNADKGKWTFRLFHESAKFASGRLVEA